MATTSGAGIVIDGLIINMDAANVKTTKGRKYNGSPWDNWVTGDTGSATDWGQNGATNSRVDGTNPWGNTDTLWRAVDADVDSNPDGGWVTSPVVQIDPNKMYRFTTWVKHPYINGGNFYLGLYGRDEGNNNTGMQRRSNDTNNTNPYFVATGRSLFATNTWYLVVGYVWPAGSGAGADHPEAGIYEQDGTVLSSTTTNWMWRPEHTNAYSRSYLYYTTDTQNEQLWYHPRIDVIDGTEPTLQELLDDAGNTFFDPMNDLDAQVSANSYSQTMLSETNKGAFTFNASEGWLEIPNDVSMDFDAEQTIEIWMKPTAFTERRNPYDQAYGGAGTWTMETNGAINYFFGTNGGNAQTYTSLNSGGILSINETACITTTRDASNIYCYKNGEQVATRTNPYGAGVVSGTRRIAIGSGYTGHRFLGDIYSVRIYTRALTATEVKRNFQSARGRHGI